MDKRFAICAAAILVLALLGILAYGLFEIYPRKTWVSPGMEASANPFLAMDRWLAQSGHPLRVEKRDRAAVIAASPEKMVIVQAAFCDWEKAGEILGPWIEAGSSLLVSLDPSFYDEALGEWLTSLGIRVSNFPGAKNAEPEETEPEEIADNEPEGETAAKISDDDAKLIPDFYYDIDFFVEPDRGIFTMKNRYGEIKLARLALGRGSLIVTGRLRFMSNRFLERDVNARLAWELSAGNTSAENPGILFVRDKRVTKGLFGKIADRGNIVPLAVSAALLIILGFWMVIPAFGLLSGEKRVSARPIRERFLGELRFLRKYHALDYYAAIYERELKRKNRETENSEMEKTEIPLSYRNIIRKLRKMQSLLERV
jgi:hypothetical protein